MYPKTYIAGNHSPSRKKSRDSNKKKPMFAKNLRCEYLVNPLGVDVIAPRLSWLLDPGDDDPNGLYQLAYQVIVASSPEQFNVAAADLWDSGKIESPETAQIAYGGKPLESRAWCYWKVKVWSNRGGESSFQECELAYWHGVTLETRLEYLVDRCTSGRTPDDPGHGHDAAFARGDHRQRPVALATQAIQAFGQTEACHALRDVARGIRDAAQRQSGRGS